MANLDASAVAPEDRVRFYKLKVQSVFERVKKLQSKVDSDALADHSDSTLNVLLEHIDKLSHSFSKAHESLEELEFTEMSSNLRTDFDDLIMVMQSTIMSEVQSRTAQVHHSSTFSRPSDPPRASAPRLQAAPALPPLKLPTFSGGYANWADFYSMFSTIIESRPEISNMERLQHLRSCLDGAALDTVRSLEISNDNYTIAINLLKQRYENRKLRELSDSFNVHMRALSSLGTTEQIASAMIAQILLQKLDEASQAKWEEKLDNSETALQIPRYEEVSSFLELRCRTLESMKFALTNYSSSKPMNSCSKVATSRSAFLVTGHSTHSCNFCNDLEHTIYKCPRFANLSPSLRLNEVRKAGLCLNCLKGGHQSRQCGSRSCRVCGVKHHTLLHLGHSSTSQAAIPPHQQSSTSRVQTIPQPSAPATTLLSKDRHSDVVLLATAVVLARNRFGELVPCRALLDSGSQLHLITARFANLLQLKRTKSVASVCGVGDSNVAMDGSSICLTLQAHASEYTTSITAMVATNITGRQPSSNVNTSNVVDLLIGASLFYDLLCVGQIKLMPGLPLLQKTRLGWVVSGGEARNHNSVLIASKTPLDPITDSCADIKLDSLVRRFWEVERCSDSILQELKRLFLSDTHQKAVKDFCLADSIEWHFIPPRSPHFGGLWEAAVKTAKHHFYRCVGSSVLTYDELRTLVCNIAAVVNSRPLVSISEHPSDIDVLTPAHFLNGGPPSSFSEPNLTGLNFNRLDAWQRVSYLQQVFWTRWRDEYLNLLQQRAKWRTSKPGLAVGNIVLVKDENLPSLKWPLARIIELIPGSDGVARVALLKTEVGEIRRATNKLCLLPLKDSVED
ncbi:uncharacterized protein LOC122757320 [Drosophila mojavensis]|uniref:uncharacterized protein LOC122757320 n=1 Tax=Drosophila mojavensis TaxID=7230 RepID=UPI001CD1855C|nr:uncharacterized protein LOC122757320 [Drosophila mojavensis]